MLSLLADSFKMKAHCLQKLCRKLLFTLALTLLIFMFNFSLAPFRTARGLSEYDRYVHNFINSSTRGNWTFVEKPMFPVYFNESQIPVGSNWTIVCPLVANHTYHIYCYGKWIDYGPNPLTDYDIYVYNPLGELEGYHTESAGLPEHLGTTVDEPFFTSKYSGNYSFVIRNDPRESNSSEQATFMIMEDVECNKWHEVFIEGKRNNESVFHTAWAFEFFTESQHVEVWIKVPETLDMYEARLYLMANPEAGMGEMLNGVPLAWEQGLYGEVSGLYGGCTLESRGFRGVAYASCEFYGQDMLINYTSSAKGKFLYHLVLIGEEGAGTVKFLVKTQFGNACLKPVNLPLRVYPENETELTFISNSTDIKNATLYYSINNWNNFTAISMQLIDNRTCTATIPNQPAGTTVHYHVEATDSLENSLTYSGNYTVKYASTLSLNLTRKAVTIGENITLTGFVSPAAENLPITLIYASTNGTFQQTVYTLANGTFKASFKPKSEGEWTVQAVFQGSDTIHPSSSSMLKFRVEPPSFLSRYSIYIFAGIGAVACIAAVIYVKKFRE